ncbi:MAG: beta-galactosidase [Planctomycetales bacterium]|nr:beta-galactosidase [Planctomycetales bacterium]
MGKHRFFSLLTTVFGVASLLSGAVSADQNSHGPGALRPDGRMYVGADYYPEHWPEERWETDFRLMQEAGFNVVRMAEFAWVNMEPEEGRFDFSWLDRAVDLAHQHNIDVILGTPTAVMPAWLARRYPEALSMKADGSRTVWGGRRHNCFSDQAYRRLSERVVRKMAEHFRDHPAVVGWQIDNELAGADCRCEKCRIGFQNWLRQKYGGLPELNSAWGNRFWGLLIGDWDEVPIPDYRTGDWAISNPSASLDWNRFGSWQNVEFLEAQASILRSVCPKQHFITHNLMGKFGALDYSDLARNLDFVSWDNYPGLHPHIPYDAAFYADFMRGLKKKNFLVMEQTAGPLGWGVFSRNPSPGEIRRICYQQLAHGADGQVWFRWRTCTAGREQYWHGLLGHDGKPGRRYREAAQVAGEYQQLAKALAGTSPNPEVAIVFDYDSQWALEIQNGYSGASHSLAIAPYYQALFRAGVPVDIVRAGDDFSRYKLVLAPHLHVLPDAVATRLDQYVKGGGVLLTDCRTGVKDGNNLAHARTLPGLLSDALGIRIDEYESTGLGISDDSKAAFSVQWSPGGDTHYTAGKYADWVSPTTAQRIAGYSGQRLKEYAAVTRNRYGDGIGWYVGSPVEEPAFYDELAARLMRDASVTPVATAPRGVEAAVRQGPGRKLLLLVNHTDQDQDVPVPAGKAELLTGATTSDTIRLGEFGVAVIQISNDK